MTGKQRSFLRKHAHKLDHNVQIGDKGVHDALIQSLEDILRTHELIKIKVNREDIYDKDIVKVYALEIQEKTKSEIIGVIGTTIILYKESDNEKNRKYNLKKLQLM